MGHLAGDHVDLVGTGGRDEHVRVPRPCPVEHIGIACKSSDTLHIQRVGCAADEIGVAVDHGDVVELAREIAGDLPADLPGTANDDFHAWLTWPRYHRVQ